MEPSSGRAFDNGTDARRIPCLLGFFSEFGQDSDIDIDPDVEIRGPGFERQL
jgi:hypothetical protein